MCRTQERKTGAIRPAWRAQNHGSCGGPWPWPWTYRGSRLISNVSGNRAISRSRRRRQSAGGNSHRDPQPATGRWDQNRREDQQRRQHEVRIEMTSNAAPSIRDPRTLLLRRAETILQKGPQGISAKREYDPERHRDGKLVSTIRSRESPTSSCSAESPAGRSGEHSRKYCS